MSGFGPKALDVAARIGDGYINTAPDARAGRALQGRPRRQARPRRRQGGAIAPTQDEGWEHAHRLWPNAGLPGELAQVLPDPEHFEQASELVTMESTRESRGRRRRPADASRADHAVRRRRATTSSTSPTWGRTTGT